MQRKHIQQMDETLPLPQPTDRRRGLVAVGAESVMPEKADELSWFGQRLAQAGFIRDMAQVKPPGFYVNWTTVSGVLLILSAVIGGWLFTYNMTWNAAYQKGLDDAEKKIILERLEKAETDAKKAKELQLYNNGAKEEAPKKEKK